MDSNTMHIEFRVRFNRINSNKNKGFLPQEIDIFLNGAMSEFIKDIVDTVTPLEGFEDTQGLLDKIRTIVKSDSSNPANNGTLTLNTFNRGKYINIPSDYLRRISVSADTNSFCTRYNYVPTRVYSNEKVNTILVTPFYRSHVKSPVTSIHNNDIKVYEDKFTVNSIYITYLTKYPAIVYNSVDCILPVDTHDDIVDMAVSKANSVLNSGNYEKYLNEIKNK